MRDELDEPPAKAPPDDLPRSVQSHRLPPLITIYCSEIAPRVDQFLSSAAGNGRKLKVFSIYQQCASREARTKYMRRLP